VEVLEEDQGHLALALAITGTAGVTVGIVDAVGGADVFVGKLRISLSLTGHPFLSVFWVPSLGELRPARARGMPWPSPWPVAGVRAWPPLAGPTVHLADSIAVAVPESWQ
jgi:hypothetical protein